MPRTQLALCYFFLLPLPFKYQVLDLQYEDTIGALAELEALGHPWQVPLFHCVDQFLSDTDQCLFQENTSKKYILSFFGVNQLKMFQGKLDALTCSDSRDIGEQRAFNL